MNAPVTRFVVFHTPGDAWQAGVDFREQSGIRDHVLHYRQVLEDGKLELGGPFLDAGLGGMMLTAQGLTRDEVEGFAAADPAVRSGLLRFEVRVWLTAMSR